MKEISATHLARQLRRVLNAVEYQGAAWEIVRNKQRIARLVPGTQRMTALEALSDLYNILPEAPAARGAAARQRRRGKAAPRHVAQPLIDATIATLTNPWDF